MQKQARNSSGAPLLYIDRYRYLVLRRKRRKLLVALQQLRTKERSFYGEDNRSN